MSMVSGYLVEQQAPSWMLVHEVTGDLHWGGLWIFSLTSCWGQLNWFQWRCSLKLINESLYLAGMPLYPKGILAIQPSKVVSRQLIPAFCINNAKPSDLCAMVPVQNEMLEITGQTNCTFSTGGRSKRTMALLHQHLVIYRHLDQS